MSPLSVEVWIYIMTAYLAVSLILYAISRLVCVTRGKTRGVVGKVTAYLAMSLILYAISRLVRITRGIAHIAYLLKYGSMTISGLVCVKRGITCGNTWHNTWH